jgi:Family of unknown function (DUF5937)
MGIGIRFRLPANAPDRLAFAYSPVLEELLALHVLTEPKHHPLQQAWVADTWRRIEGPLVEEVRAWGFAYAFSVPEFALPAGRGAIPDFDGALRDLDEIDTDFVAYELARVLFQGELGDQTVRDPAELLVPEHRAAALAEAERRGGRTLEISELAFDDRAAFVGRFTGMLRSFHEAVFAEEWTRLEPLLADAIGQAGQVIASDGIYGFLQDALPESNPEPDAGHITFDRDCDIDLLIDQWEHLTLIPSAFIAPHTWISCDEPWPRAVIYAPATIGSFFTAERSGSTSAPTG